MEQLKHALIDYLISSSKPEVLIDLLYKSLLSDKSVTDFDKAKLDFMLNNKNYFPSEKITALAAYKPLGVSFNGDEMSVYSLLDQSIIIDSIIGKLLKSTSGSDKEAVLILNNLSNEDKTKFKNELMGELLYYAKKTGLNKDLSSTINNLVTSMFSLLQGVTINSDQLKNNLTKVLKDYDPKQVNDCIVNLIEKYSSENLVVRLGDNCYFTSEAISRELSNGGMERLINDLVDKHTDLNRPITIDSLTDFIKTNLTTCKDDEVIHYLLVTNHLKEDKSGYLFDKKLIEQSVVKTTINLLSALNPKGVFKTNVIKILKGYYGDLIDNDSIIRVLKDNFSAVILNGNDYILIARDKRVKLKEPIKLIDGESLKPFYTVFTNYCVNLKSDKMLTSNEVSALDLLLNNTITSSSNLMIDLIKNNSLILIDKFVELMNKEVLEHLLSYFDISNKTQTSRKPELTRSTIDNIQKSMTQDRLINKINS